MTGTLPPVTTLVLVEGASDAAAVRALARRCGRDLAHVDVVAMGGATNLRRHLERRDPGVQVRGLCDAREAGHVARTLARAGLGDGDPARLAEVGFFVCVEDLEDELVRALGVAAVARVVAAQGDLGPLRSLQQQPAQRDRPPEQQLRRWFGSGSGRKARYAPLLVDALETVPAPLAGLLARL